MPLSLHQATDKIPWVICGSDKLENYPFVSSSKKRLKNVITAHNDMHN